MFKNYESYPDILKVADVQKILGTSRTKTYKIIRNHVRHMRIGKCIRVPKHFLKEYIDNGG